MPLSLVDAYIRCDEIKGSYTASAKAQQRGASLEITHDGWSEVYDFDYELSDDLPQLNITKPVDSASNALYIHHLKNRSRELYKGSEAKGALINKITLEMCRWVDTDDDGIVDKFEVFLEYNFEECRVLDYSTNINAEADDLPSEKIKFGFRKMKMLHWGKKGKKTFGWDFAKAEPITVS